MKRPEKLPAKSKDRAQQPPWETDIHCWKDIRGVRTRLMPNPMITGLGRGLDPRSKLRIIQREQREVPIGYLRQAAAAKYLSVSKRTLADWQARRIIGHRKIRGVVCFKIAELDAALEKFKIKAVS